MPGNNHDIIQADVANDKSSKERHVRFKLCSYLVGLIGWSYVPQGLDVINKYSLFLYIYISNMPRSAFLVISSSDVPFYILFYRKIRDVFSIIK